MLVRTMVPHFFKFLALASPQSLFRGQLFVVEPLDNLSTLGDNVVMDSVKAPLLSTASGSMSLVAKFSLSK